MSIIVNRSLLQEHLEAFFDGHREKIFLLHTDIGAWGLLDGVMKRDELLASYFGLLVEAARQRSLVFPLFNYDYGRTRRYDVLKDKCQVGALNEYVRLQSPERRTRTPIFNFIEMPGTTFSQGACANPFGDSSFWRDFCGRDGRVCYMGAGFSTSTFAHYAEEKQDIGYRYLKPMPGVVALGVEENPISFVYRVRPRMDGAVDYDWDRLETDLTREGLLDSKCLGIGKALSYNSRDVLDYWLVRLEEDEFYLLTDSSKAIIAELRRTKPYPFRFEDFEGEGARG